MSSKSKTLKNYFIKAILLSSLAPFIFSIILLWFVTQSFHEKLQTALNEIELNKNFQIIDSFHKIQIAAYIIARSEEINEYFQSTIDNEEHNKKVLLNLLTTTREQLTYKNTVWLIYNTRGIPLLQVPQRQSELLNKEFVNIASEKQVKLSEDQKQVVFVIPVSYFLNKKSKRFQNNLGFIVVKLPLNEIQNKFTKLIKIHNFSENLDIKNFIADYHPNEVPYNPKIVIYFYVVIFFLLLILSIYWGVKLFQVFIVDKLILLKDRVLNEFNFTNKESSSNELDALSQTFEFYIRYTNYLQEEAKKNSKLAAVGHFSQFIAHDIRKPFSQFQLFIDELKLCKNFKNIPELILRFEDKFTHSKNYIEHLLKENMEAGIHQLAPSDKVTIEKILKNSFAHFVPFNENKDIKIEYNLKNTHMLNIDEPRICRVLINIISNAIDAIPQDGKIWIETFDFQDKNQNKIKIIIGNSNSFISHENLNKIFEPFYTLKKSKGTGLGLSIAQKIISLHGGKISCQSEKLKGVEFIFDLPAHQDTYEHNLEGLPFVLKTKKKSELNHIYNKDLKECLVVIDDDPLICRSWQRHLDKITVFVFLRPEDFFNYCKQNDEFLKFVSIIISDYFFDKNSSYDFERFIKALREIYFKKVYLSSDVILLDNIMIDKFDIIKIEKRPHSLDELKKL